MTLRNTDKTYGSAAKFFHWVIAIGIILMLCAGVSFGYLPDGPFKYQLVQLLFAEYQCHMVGGERVNATYIHG